MIVLTSMMLNPTVVIESLVVITEFDISSMKNVTSLVLDGDFRGPAITQRGASPSNE